MYLMEIYKDNIRVKRMAHSYLDGEMLSRNALFRNKNGELVGVYKGGCIIYGTAE